MVPVMPYAPKKARPRSAALLILLAFVLGHVILQVAVAVLIGEDETLQTSGAIVGAGSVTRAAVRWVNGSHCQWGAAPCSLLAAAGLGLLIAQRRGARATLVVCVIASLLLFATNLTAHAIAAGNSPIVFRHISGITQCEYFVDADVVISSLFAIAPALALCVIGARVFFSRRGMRKLQAEAPL